MDQEGSNIRGVKDWKNTSLPMNPCSNPIPIAHPEGLAKSFIKLSLINVFYPAYIDRCVKNLLGVMVCGLSRYV